jgi:uncharacterized protein DUF4062
MGLYDSTKTLTMFLASPGDLGSERQAVRDIVKEVNDLIGRPMRWHIELLGWEDTLPGYGRPQEHINEDVDRCELFIGMLWWRWGQPTGHGKYSSGFEEEYDRALTRRRSTGPLRYGCSSNNWTLSTYRIREYRRKE